MQFHTDNHFNIGAEHVLAGKPCQDYAISGVHEGAAYAVVSDGCSSGGHTDVGARLMSLSTAAAIREHWSSTRNATNESSSQDVEVHQRLILGGIKETLRLDQQDMLATVLYAYITPNGGYVKVRGDGVIAFVYEDGPVALRRYDWPNNTPFYPAYADDSLPDFISTHGGDVNKLVLQEQIFLRETVGFGEFAYCGHSFHSISDGIKGITRVIDAENIEALSYIAVFSDGVTRVDGVDWKDAATRLLAFKSAEGVFAKRRMINFVREARKVGKGPLDDVAYAVIRVTHDEEKGETDDNA